MIHHTLYQNTVRETASLALPWEKLANTNFLITGASGLIGSCLIDVLMYRNLHQQLNCHIYAVGRNLEKARQRFSDYWDLDCFTFLSHDINRPLDFPFSGSADYVLHLASNTHPVAYATDPIGTVTTNILGTHNLLEFAASHQNRRFAFASSNEIYGENRGDAEFFDESYCGYLDCNTMRAGYPESKRCGEALCQAYKSQKQLDVVIPRFTRSYGPTMLPSDTKAISQFIRKGMAGEDIILKSAGTQFYSYTYVADAVSGLLFILLLGENGQAYNIADPASDLMLKDLASLIASLSKTKVVFELPDALEQSGYSTATKARLDGSKLRALGWTARYDIQKGLEETLTVLRDLACV